MKMVTLADVADQVRGVTYGKTDVSDVPAHGYLPVLRANNITDEGLDFSDLVYVEARCVADRQMVRNGDIVVAASSGSLKVVGKAAQASHDFAGGFGAFCKVVRPRANVNPRYLGHYFRSSVYRRIISSLAAGANINNIRNEHIDDLQIFLPPLPEQERVAAILDQANAYRSACQRLLQKFDALDRAEFGTAFGDPRQNTMGWLKRPLSQLIEPIESGWSPNCLDRPASGNEWAVLKLGSVTYGRFNASANKALPADITPRKQIEVHLGDVLFSRKNTRDLVAASVLVTEETERMMMPDLLFRLRPKDESVLTSEFMQAAISFPTLRKHIQSLAGGAAGSMPNISKSKLNAVELIVPPIEQQKAYSAFRHGLERERRSHLSRISAAESLKKVLEHRAFRGEL